MIKPLVTAIRKTQPYSLNPNDPMYYVKGYLLGDQRVLSEFRAKLARMYQNPSAKGATSH